MCKTKPIATCPMCRMKPISQNTVLLLCSVKISMPLRLMLVHVYNLVKFLYLISCILASILWYNLFIPFLGASLAAGFCQQTILYLYYVSLSTLFPVSMLSLNMHMSPQKTSVVLLFLSILKYCVFFNVLMISQPFSGGQVEDCYMLLILCYIIFLGVDFPFCPPQLHVREVSGCITFLLATDGLFCPLMFWIIVHLYLHR